MCCCSLCHKRYRIRQDSIVMSTSWPSKDNIPKKLVTVDHSLRDNTVVTFSVYTVGVVLLWCDNSDLYPTDSPSAHWESRLIFLFKFQEKLSARHSLECNVVFPADTSLMELQ